jgi:diadenosine tetraphosphate (Ap4A) HIT family hydrolase
VPHLHVHILPRYPGDKVRLNWVYTPGDKAEIEAICNRLKGAL